MRKAVALISFLIILSGCKNEYYSLNQIHVHGCERKRDAIYLAYAVPMETMYYSSGCDIFYNEDSTSVTLQFIRQRINTKASVHITSKIIKDKKKSYYLIKLPKTIIHVFIDSKQLM